MCIRDSIKTSGGKIVAPQKIEGLLKGRPLIAEAVVVGDNLKFCSALLVVDEDALQAWAKRTGNAAQVRAPKTLAFLQEQIDAVNRDLASFESIKYFRVIEDQFTIDNGLLTASYKVKRKVVNQRYAHLIEEMYGAQASGRTAA